VVSAVEGAEIVFRLDDPDGNLTAVRLWQELGVPGDSLDFQRVDDGWELRLPRPPVHRMEYLFQVTGVDGEQATAVDPTNPRVVGGAFGDHSVLELPGYRTPSWCTAEERPSRLDPLTIAGTPLGTVTGQIWSPDDADPDEMLPLLVSHDGPEFAAHAALTRYVGAMVAGAELPRMRLAMLAPGQRDSWYAGYTGDHLAVVWMGNDRNQQTGLYGSTGAMRVWSGIFSQLPSTPLKVAGKGLDWQWVVGNNATDPSCPGARQLPFVAGFAPPYSPCVVEPALDQPDEGGGWRSWFGLDREPESAPEPAEPAPTP